MALFTGRVVNKVDRKGRVSIPAAFRNQLAGQTLFGVAVYPSVDRSPSLTACGVDVLEGLGDRFRATSPFDPTYTDARMALFADVQQLPFDSDGRVLLTADLLEHAGITTHAAFVGMGDLFRIWDPDAADAVLRAVREKSPEERAQLELPPPPGAGR